MHHVKGVQTFEQIRTVENVIYPTFKAEAIKLGILESDSEWIDCLRETTSFNYASQLRELFATILSFCEPTDPVLLWHMFKKELSDDILYRFKTTVDSEIIFNEAFIEIKKVLKNQINVKINNS